MNWTNRGTLVRRRKCSKCGRRALVVDFDCGHRSCADCMIAEAVRQYLVRTSQDAAGTAGDTGKRAQPRPGAPATLDLRDFGEDSPIPLPDGAGSVGPNPR